MAANNVDDPSLPFKQAKTGAATYGTKFKPEWSKNSPLSPKATLIQCTASTAVCVEGMLAVVIKELQILKGMKNLCHILIKR